MNIETPLTPEEVAPMLRCKVTSVRRYCFDGQLRAAKIGGHYRIFPSEVHRFLTEGSAPKNGRPKGRKTHAR